jgi:hypothetical protein
MEIRAGRGWVIPRSRWIRTVTDLVRLREILERLGCP